MNDNTYTGTTTWIPNTGGGWNPPTTPGLPFVPFQPSPLPPPPVSPGGAWYSAESMRILIDAIRASERATVLAELEELKRQAEEQAMFRERLAEAKAEVQRSSEAG